MLFAPENVRVKYKPAQGRLVPSGKIDNRG